MNACSTIVTQDILCHVLYTALIYKDAGNQTTSQLSIWDKMAKPNSERKQVMVIVVTLPRQCMAFAVGNTELKFTSFVTYLFLIIS